ncbi:hypothetical protein Hypma_012668 [Hypsizygus marmoreus]|uniref:WW domain-containing protein n=1 Tax=Hypsizygus marmoreus TaxID=39966 RepID=A0A151VHX9_HYPMA|nr:hypothetical protein Hypma_005199 [Hypsizygus marmoreus]RDB20214.1 hypothetical protein Hypma_012668 [Hypsizygus marmoreus]
MPSVLRFKAPISRTNFSRLLVPRNIHTTSRLSMPKKSFVPADWRIIETSPGGIDRSFVNDKTGESTWYTPKGLSADEILQIPGAKKYWSTKEKVEEYVQQMNAEEEKYRGKDDGS